jgi:hypothetical protein
VNNSTKVQRGQREPKEQAVNSVEQVVNSCEQVPLENIANPMVFEGLQKQKTEAEDRDTSSLEASSSHETVVPQAHPPAAPPALGPADPDVEPDWDALFVTVPLTYDDDEATDDQATEDEGTVGTQAGAPPEAPVVASGLAAEHQHEVEVGMEGALPPGGPPGPGSLLTPEASATQPPPATRKRKAARPAPVGDVETLWEAWRNHGSVRGEPNDHRRRAMERVLRDYPLADVLEMLDAAHTGSTDNWRWLQGATSRSDRAFLKPENLLVAAKLAARMEDAQDWVKAGRPRHQVEKTRAEARAEAAARPALERARKAWPYAVKLIGRPPEAFGEVTEGWPEANRKALADGLHACGGLMTLGRADKWKLDDLRRKFLAGVVAALGGTVTEAELREVG